MRLSAGWLRAADFDGRKGIQVLGCVEDPSRVMMLIEWDSVEAHAATRGTPAHDELKRNLATYLRAPTVVQHYAGTSAAFSTSGGNR